jgi:hypothetical protein
VHPAHGGRSRWCRCIHLFRSSLERQSQSEVDFTVAHEFAHASLRHHEPENLMTFSMDEARKGYLNWESEVAADELVGSWGYEIPKRRKRKREQCHRLGFCRRLFRCLNPRTFLMCSRYSLARRSLTILWISTVTSGTGGFIPFSRRNSNGIETFAKRLVQYGLLWATLG